MAQLSWHRRDNEEMLALVRQLDLEAYAMICAFIDLFVSRNGNVPDDDRFIAGNFSKPVPTWRRIKKRLIALELLEVRGDQLFNPIAEQVWHEAMRRYQITARAGRASQQKQKESRRNSRTAPKELETRDENLADESNRYSNLPRAGVRRPFERFR
jgi:hypothetical protein